MTTGAAGAAATLNFIIFGAIEGTCRCTKSKQKRVAVVKPMEWERNVEVG
jgi:hypothetical protein